jgi:hypothetical protein
MFRCVVKGDGGEEVTGHFGVWYISFSCMHFTIAQFTGLLIDQCIHEPIQFDLDVSANAEAGRRWSLSDGGICVASASDVARLNLPALKSSSAPLCQAGDNHIVFVYTVLHHCCR